MAVWRGTPDMAQFTWWDLGIAVAGSSVVGTALGAGLKSGAARLAERRLEKKAAKDAALAAADLLEGFARNAANRASEWVDVTPDDTPWPSYRMTAPDRDAIDWRALDSSLAADWHRLGVFVDLSNDKLSGLMTIEPYAIPEEAHEAMIEIGVVAWRLAVEMRANHGHKPLDHVTLPWDFVEYLLSRDKAIAARREASRRQTEAFWKSEEKA